MSAGPLWLGPEILRALLAGEEGALPRAIAMYARHCLKKASGVAACSYARCEFVSPERTPEQRALLAIGLDLVELLRASPEGLKALQDLRLEPVAKGPKSE